jgi:hypothetical protein
VLRKRASGGWAKRRQTLPPPHRSCLFFLGFLFTVWLSFMLSKYVRRIRLHIFIAMLSFAGPHLIAQYWILFFDISNLEPSSSSSIYAYTYVSYPRMNINQLIPTTVREGVLFFVRSAFGTTTLISRKFEIIFTYDPLMVWFAMILQHLRRRHICRPPPPPDG